MFLPAPSSIVGRFTFALGALVAVASFAACSSSSTGNGTSGTSGTGSTGTPATAADCASRCQSKFTTCGATAPQASSSCQEQVCGSTVTTDQLTCLEGKTCDQIANSTSFATLCPGSTTTTPPPATGATCGSATCATGEYCNLTYDSSTSAWKPSACKKIPTACASSSSLCSCMTENSGCSTSGLVSTKCSQDNGALSFGCQ